MQPHQALPEGYSIRPMESRDYDGVASICARVYASERPYTDEELATHHRVFPDGQFVVVHDDTRDVAGAQFTLILRLEDFHLDDPWDVITAHGLFTDHDPIAGHTLYGADLMVDPGHQHHGLGRALTLAARDLAREKKLWRMAGASRMPHYGRHLAEMSAEEYVRAVVAGLLTDPVLTVHLHDGWEVVTAIRGYLPHDAESAGWAAVIQWLNPDSPPPPEFDIRRFSRRSP